jgi:DNA polymerase III alpha subunit
MPDIDIDFADRTLALEKLKHAVARLDDNKKHNTGVYVQNIPSDPVTKLSTIEYKTAEDRGYFKIDFLNVNVYERVKSRAHLNHLMNTEPIWDLLLEDEFTDKLFHVNGHGGILREMEPRSIEQLAAVLAMIRPAKRYLIGKDWDVVMKEVWLRPDGDEYYFKKAHAVAYAHVIVVQMNLICEELANLTD